MQLKNIMIVNAFKRNNKENMDHNQVKWTVKLA